MAQNTKGKALSTLEQLTKALKEGDGATSRKRALMRGRARNLESYARIEETMRGGPSRREDGTIELRPIRGFACGLSAAEIRARLERLSGMVEQAAEMGATVIWWG